MDSRRSFFKEVVGDIARGVRQIRDEIAGPPTGSAPSRQQATPATPPPRPAPPTARGASPDELLALADEVGLHARRDAVRTLARASVRLTPAAAGAAMVAGGSRLGGAPDLPDGTTWPHWSGAPLTFRLQLDLAEVAAALAGGGAESIGLPDAGVLACFTADEQPDGMRRAHDGACAVLLADAPAAGAEPAYGQPAVLSRELTLPRAWAAPVAALELDAGEQELWSDLRRRLAALQGVAPFDETRGEEVPHRLHGYPDERRGTMPLACALLAEGVDLAGTSPAQHPRASSLTAATERWRLLLQLAVDGDLGWRWAENRERLYVWAHDDDLAAGDLSRIRAFVQ